MKALSLKQPFAELILSGKKGYNLKTIRYYLDWFIMAKIFSIKQKYSTKILKKEKLVEFRRQNVNVYHKEICLIYTSSPIKKIEGYFIVKEKLRLPIKELWRRTKRLAGISLEEFTQYFEGCIIGTAILFRKVGKLEEELSLNQFRMKVGKLVTPPQSYCNIDNSALDNLNITTM